MFDLVTHKQENFGLIQHDTVDDLFASLHGHDTYEFVYCMEGTLDIKVLDNTYSIASNQAILLNPCELHSYSSSKLNKVYICNFAKNLVNEYYDSHKNLVAKNPVFSFDNAQQFIKELVAEKTVYFQKAMLYQVLKMYSNNATFLPFDRTRNELLCKVTNLMSQNVKNPQFSLMQIAKKLNYSYNYLSGIFNVAFSMGFAEIMNTYRIGYACELLQTTGKSIGEIAKEVGYTSIRTFNRNYKNIVGNTPSKGRIEQNKT